MVALGGVSVEREFFYLAQQVNALSELTDAKFVTFRTLVDSQADKVALALTASEKAIGKAEVATEKRFDGVNEFREQLRDQASTLMPRSEAEQRLQAMSDRFEASLVSAQREKDTLAERVLVLERVVSASAAADKGQAATWAKIGAVVAALAAVMAIVGTVIVIASR